MKALQLREIVFGPSHISRVCTVLDHLFCVRSAALTKVLRLVALRVSPSIVDNDSTYFFKTFVVSCLFVQILASLLAIASSEKLLCPMSGWVCQWKSGSSSVMVLLKDQAPQIRVKSFPGLQGCRSVPLRYLGSLRSPKIKCVWERSEAPLPPLRSRPKCDFIHPRQLSPFPERLVLPFSNEFILSDYAELDSSGNDDPFTSSAKLSDHEILVEHMVDMQKATAEFRETYYRRDTTSSQSWTPWGKRRCLRTTNSRKVAYHYLA